MIQVDFEWVVLDILIEWFVIWVDLSGTVDFLSVVPVIWSITSVLYCAGAGVVAFVADTDWVVLYDNTFVEQIRCQYIALEVHSFVESFDCAPDVAHEVLMMTSTWEHSY